MSEEIVPFDQILFQLFFDLVKSTGQGLNLDQIEKIRAASTRMAALVNAQVQLTVLQNLKEFQENIQTSFEALRAELKGNIQRT